MRALLTAALVLASAASGAQTTTSVQPDSAASGAEAVRPEAIRAELVADTTGRAAYARGLAAYDAERWADASTALAEALRANPAFISARGSAAFFLGDARRRSDRGDAVEVWVAGREALARAGVHDLRLDSALVGAASGDAEVGAAAAAAFLDLVESGAAPFLDGHLEPLALVLPAELAAGATPEAIGVAGPEIASWWRRQDPRPGTPANERLVEHLARVAYARAEFAPEGAIDARGRIWIRFGPPAKTGRIEIGAGITSRFVGSRVPSFRPSDVPVNEIWSYPGVDVTATYLVVQRRGGAFEIGTPDDLVPRALQQGLGTSERGVRKAQALLFVLESIYRQLAVFDGRYAPYALDLEVYTDLLETAEREAALANRAAAESDDAIGAALALSAPRSAQVLLSALPQPPSVFASVAFGEAEANGDAFAAERRDRVPPAVSRAAPEAEVLPVSFRWARFLTASGHTRVEAYWALPPNALGVTGADTVHVGWRAVEEGEGGRPLARHQADLLAPTSGGVGDEFPPQLYAFPAPNEAMALALEWGISPAQRSGGRVQLGDLAALAVLRVDSIPPLATDRLEMSDFKPIRAGLGEPYPYGRVVPGDAVNLYFEIYGLRESAGPSGFVVEYEIVRRRNGSLLRRSRETVQEGDLVSTVEGTRSAQYLLLNTRAWEGADEVEVIVRTRDVTTRDTVERRITYGVAG